MADLTQPGWQDSVTDSEIAQVIRNGRGQMPGFGDKLRPAAVDALVRHVRGFGPDRGGGDGTSDAGNTKQGAPDGGPGE
jgi:mono/diheme cytochrome c family protein